ncbi:MAG TPA: hypothetical protein VK604_10175 [Bryobacteraceae bacterium]|nr:hypothetical protein [Bryobacteraceae bacterium]
MQGLTTYQFRTARYLSVGVLAASSFLYSQSIPPSAAAPSAAGQPAPNSNGPNSNGGWKRVGDSSVQVQTAQSEPVEQAPAYPPNDPNQGPPPPAGQGPYAQQPNPGGSAPQQSYGQQPGYGQQSGQQPMYQPPPVPASLTIPAGTFFTVRTNQLLSTDKNQTGDAFSATLVQPVVVNGVVVAEPGQTLAGRVAESVKAGHVEGTARLGIQLTELTLVDGQQLPIQSALVSRKGSTSVGRDAGAIAGTTGLGAAIGAAAGWGTGAAIGAGAGAAAGVIGVLVTRGHPSVIYPEQLLTFRIDVPLTVSTVRAPQAFRYIQPNEYDRPMESQQAPYDGPGPYASAGAYPAPAPAYYGAYGYPNYGYGWGYGYPYYSGFSLFLGGGYYGRGFYGGRGYYGGRGFYGGGRGFYGGGRGYVGRGGGGRR